MAGRAMVQDLVVATLVQDGTAASTQRVRVTLSMEGSVPYRPTPGQALDLDGVIAWVLRWSARSEPSTLSTLLADLIDRCFDDARVHTVTAEVWLDAMPGEPARGVGLSLDRTVHALQRSGGAAGTSPT